MKPILGYIAVFALLLSLGITLTTQKPVPYDRMKQTTVEVYDSWGHGSGVIVSPNYILTANHVVDGAPEGTMSIKFSDGSVGEAVVVWTDPDRDVALMALTKATSIAPAKLATQPLKVGDSVWVAGYPLLLPLSIQQGELASNEVPAALAKDFVSANSTIILNCTILRGDSGGPVFNSKGEVVGINDIDFIDVLGGVFPVWTGMAGAIGMQFIATDVHAVTGI